MIRSTSHLKIGFLGTGNLAQAMIKRIIESGKLKPSQIYGSNRSEGKLKRLVDTLGINACATNEDLIETCDWVILGCKPQDLLAALEPMASVFSDRQVVLSLAVGHTLKTLQNRVPQACWGRIIPNTPSQMGEGLVACYLPEENSWVRDQVSEVFSPLGTIVHVSDEENLTSVAIASGSGVGFVYELMMYWQDWLEEHDFSPDLAREITVKTFLGASMMATKHTENSLEDLQNKVTSKKGITAAGLESIRELEIERSLRISFEKASMRDQELAKTTN